MKKLILAAVALLSVTCFSYAGKSVTAATYKSVGNEKTISPSQVPAAVISSFNSNFPTATNVVWERKSENGSRIYEAEFTMDGRRWEARFMPDGTLIRVRRTNSGGGN